MSFQTNQNISLVIPRVFPQWIDEQKIIQVFHEQRIGRIFKVSIKRMSNETECGIPIYKAYLYFSVWYCNEIAYNFQRRLLTGQKQARVVYDDPWFWVSFENKFKRLNRTDQRLIRIDREFYHNEQIMANQLFEHQQELIEQRNLIQEHKEQIQEHKEKIQVQQQSLAEQQRNMEHLQRFCIQRGLNVPFWNPKNPPADVELDIALAETTVRVAEAVLNYDDDTDDINLDTNQLANEMTQQLLAESSSDDINLDTNQLANEMTEQVLAECDAWCVCEACIGGEEFYINEYYNNHQSYDPKYIPGCPCPNCDDLRPLHLRPVQ
jgi:hypothetical protein